ncbi:MAG: hypothetical protein IJD92_03495 [Bacilli bacterium]|nr:hypothetical protein [Bacilli bacterium]
MKNYYEITVYLVKLNNNKLVGYNFIDKINMICKKVPYGYKEIKKNLFIYNKNIIKKNNEYIINVDNLLKYNLNKNGVILITDTNLNKPIQIFEQSEIDYYNFDFYNNTEVNSFINKYNNLYKEHLCENKKRLEKYKKYIEHFKKNIKKLKYKQKHK